MVDPSNYPWTEGTLEKALGDLRNFLEKDGEIQVVEEKGEGPIKRKVWVKNQ